MISKASAAKTADQLEAAGAIAAPAASAASGKVSTETAVYETADGNNGAAAAVGDKVVAKKSKRQIRKVSAMCYVTHLWLDKLYLLLLLQKVCKAFPQRQHL